MSVIGRLDGQVDEVIIKPVSRRRTPGESDATETALRPPASTRDEPRETRHPDRSATPRGEPPGDGELPVWLL